MCGIFGVAGHEEASNLTYLGLYALQHRGQESAGIVSTDGRRVYKSRKRKLVSEAFDSESIEYLKGSMAIGHVRYSTAGGNGQYNVQPFVASGSFGTLAVGHNGNLTNFETIRRNLEKDGAVFQSTMDTEIILHLVAAAKGKTLEEKIVEGLKGVEGAYSLLFLTEEKMIAVRDPHGFRPMALGMLENAPVISSETCAFDLIGAKYVRDVKPGEMISMDVHHNLQSRQIFPTRKLAPCIFEHVYFSRPDSLVFEKSVYESRKALGRELAREHRTDADVVIPVPDSGVVIAMGYAEESKIPLEFGFIRNHYVGRTFIEPKQSIRGFGVKIKLNPVPLLLKGKKVAVIDDSIVRGTTSQKIVKMVRDAGASQVHLLIGSPPVISPCFYGIDTPRKSELIAAQQSTEEICRFVGADGIQYLSVEGLNRAIRQNDTPYCDACFTGKYPTQI